MKPRSYRWDTGLRVRVLGLLLFLLTLLICLGTVLSFTFEQLHVMQQRAEHTRQNVLYMEQASGTFAEMTSSVRGYLLTGQESLLAPYSSGRLKMEQLLTNLSEAAAQDETQLGRVHMVRDLFRTWQFEYAEMEIASRRRGDLDLARVADTSRLGYADNIRATASEYIQRESDRLNVELDSAAKVAQRVQLITWSGVGLAALLALGGFAVFARSVTRSTGALAEAAHAIARGERGVMLKTPLDGELQEVADAFASMSITLAEQDRRLQRQQDQLVAQNEELLAQQEVLQSHTTKLEQQEHRLSRLHGLSSKMIGTFEVDQLGRLILDEYLDLYGGEAGALLLPEDYGERMWVQVERWLAPELRDVYIHRSGPLARCIDQCEVVVARYPETVTKLSIWQTSVPVAQEIYIPLVHTGRVIAVVVVASTKSQPLSDEALALWSAIAGQTAVALSAAFSHLEVKRALQSLQEQAAQIEMLNAQLEEERDRAAAQLDIYLSIVSTMRAGAWLADQGGHLLVVNATFKEFFGNVPERATLETMQGRFRSFLPDEDPFPEQVADLIHSATDVAEGRIRLVNGFVLQWSSAPVGSGAGRVGRLFTFQDVTELAELDRMKSEFVNTVSHELRTPLTSIMGYLGLVLAGQVGPLQEQQKEFLNVVSRNTTRLANLINDLLDVQRIESGRTPLMRQEVNLAEVVLQVAETFQLQAEQKGLAFYVAADPDSTSPIVADPDRLTQITANLVSNAIKYTKEGAVRILVRQTDHAVDLLVADTGIGVSAADQKRIFEKFYRAEHPYVREVGGTGLGLPIVRTMVEEHGGEIRLESELGKGSTFTVSFPLAGSAAEGAK